MTTEQKSWSAASIVALAIGFALLATGEITAAPVLLVLAYVVLIPVTLLRA